MAVDFNKGIEMDEFIKKSNDVIKALNDAGIEPAGIEIVLISVASTFAGMTKKYTEQEWIDRVTKIASESFKIGNGY